MHSCKVSWKADGTRYLMLIDGPGQIYFIDRDNCVFEAPEVSFRFKKNLDEHLSNTLVDGVIYAHFFNSLFQ